MNTKAKSVSDEQLQSWADIILASGPDRVVVAANGTAVPSFRACRDYEVYATVIFVRDDGWSLGAPAELEGVAEAMYRDAWVGIMRAPSTVMRRYDAASPFGMAV